MGQRGPKKTPTVQLKSRGSRAVERRGNEPEPGLPKSLDVPDHLKGDAALVWVENAPGLARCGLLTEADLATFERYCRSYALWHRAALEIENAETIERGDVSKLHYLDDMLRRLEKGFGMNPADRAGVSVDPAKKTNGKSKFFSS